MAVIRKYKEGPLRLSLESFADSLGVDIVINEREHVFPESPMRYYASMPRCEIKKGQSLSSVHGNGNSPDDAMNALANFIDGELIVVDAMKESRQEVQAWIILPNPADGR
jgi:hypothetical protein